MTASPATLTKIAAAIGEWSPSPQQHDYLVWIVDGAGSCVLEAVAGSGKTTTLIKGLLLMPGSKFFGAYNKTIADEIKTKTDAAGVPDLTVGTMHAAGFRAWRRACAGIKLEIDSDKCKKIFRAACTRNTEARYEQYESAVLALVSYAKQGAVGIVRPDDDAAWYSMIDHFDVDCLDNPKLVIALSRKTLASSIEQDRKVIDFDDMIFAPLYHKVRMYEYDWILIDEAQDTNTSRRALALAMLKRGGRLVAVGDRHQAIYGFTGADADALDLITRAVSARQMPLTVTYRCPKTVVAEAHRYVSHIQAHESAPEGRVQRGLPGGQTLITAAKPGDAILCRFNAPIIEAAFAFVAAGVPAKVEGRDIGSGLKNLARRWKVTSYAALLDKLETFVEGETAKYRAKEQESRAAAVEDKVNCLRVLIGRAAKIDPNPVSAVEAVCTEIDQIFGDKVGSGYVLLSSIHRSKGREWKRVFWLTTGPSPWARKDWELQQESNLCYVAITRAIEELIFVAVSNGDAPAVSPATTTTLEDMTMAKPAKAAKPTTAPPVALIETKAERANEAAKRMTVKSEKVGPPVEESFLPETLTERASNKKLAAQVVGSGETMLDTKRRVPGHVGPNAAKEVAAAKATVDGMELVIPTAPAARFKEKETVFYHGEPWAVEYYQSPTFVRICRPAAKKGEEPESFCVPEGTLTTEESTKSTATRPVKPVREAKAKTPAAPKAPREKKEKEPAHDPFPTQADAEKYVKDAGIKITAEIKAKIVAYMAAPNNGVKSMRIKNMVGFLTKKAKAA